MKKIVLVIAAVGIGSYLYFGSDQESELANQNIESVAKHEKAESVSTEVKLNANKMPVHGVGSKKPHGAPKSFVSFDNEFEKFKHFDSEKFFESLTEIEKKDFQVLTEVFESLVLDIPNVDDLAKSLYEKGYTPSKEKRGHPNTGMRQVLTLEEKMSSDGLLTEFYSSYIESESKLYFDRIYYGYAAKDGVFDQLVKQLDEKLADVTEHKSIRGNFVRWDVGGDKFVFINADYQLAGENIVLVGHEYEIH